MAEQMQANLQPKSYVFRPLADFAPSLWGSTFASFSIPNSEIESRTREVETLKEKVKDMLMQSTKELTQNIGLINSLCNLGLSYHFETEIEDQLNRIFTELPNLLDDKDYDLYTTALLFRILRQYGYKMPCDVFNKFKDENGKFKKDIKNDVKGLLSLYEATFLSLHGENILDESLTFTRQRLETLADEACPHLAKHIRNALLEPFHHGMERLKARQYISFYEEDESRDETLLKFAKLDFNRLQVLYKQELALLTRWWEDLNLIEKLPYARDRLVECYFFALGTKFEPQFALLRMMVTKYTQMYTLVDDTYDSYGTIDELQCFTAAFERCTIDAIDELPEYMKVLYRSLLNHLDEIDDGSEGRSYRASYAKEMLKELVGCYYLEAQWLNNGYVPTFDEYKPTALVTSSCGVVVAAAFIGMENVAGIKEYKWLQNNPKIDKAVKLISKIKNDKRTRKDELKKEEYYACIKCYMKQYGASEAEATKEMEKMSANAWKDINEECMKPTTVPRIVLNFFVNVVRTVNFLFRDIDSFTDGSGLKDAVTLLFMDPLPM